MSTTHPAAPSLDHLAELLHQATAEAEGSFHAGWDGVGAGVEDHVTLFGDNVRAGGGVGVRAGVGGELGGDVSLTADRIGVEADIGAALGVGFDVHIDASFSPTGLVQGGLHAGGAAVGQVHDWIGWP